MRGMILSLVFLEAFAQRTVELGTVQTSAQKTIDLFLGSFLECHTVLHELCLSIVDEWYCH